LSIEKENKTKELIECLDGMKSLELLKRTRNNVSSFWEVLGTDLTLLLNSEGSLHWRRFGDRGAFTSALTFEEVFELLPEEIHEEFLYHLDIFKNT